MLLEPVPFPAWLPVSARTMAERRGCHSQSMGTLSIVDSTDAFLDIRCGLLDSSTYRRRCMLPARKVLRHQLCRWWSHCLLPHWRALLPYCRPGWVLVGLVFTQSDQVHPAACHLMYASHDSWLIC